MFADYNMTEEMTGEVEGPGDRLEAKLIDLRQAIIGAERSVLVDGRFEQMIISPFAVIDVALELITELAAFRTMTMAATVSANKASTLAGSDYRQTR